MFTEEIILILKEPWRKVTRVKCLLKRPSKSRCGGSLEQFLVTSQTLGSLGVSVSLIISSTSPLNSSQSILGSYRAWQGRDPDRVVPYLGLVMRGRDNERRKEHKEVRDDSLCTALKS